MNEDKRFLDKAKSVTLKMICGIIIAWITWVTGNTIMYGKDIAMIKTENKNILEHIVYIRNRIDQALSPEEKQRGH